MSTLRCWAPVIFLAVYAACLAVGVADSAGVRWPWVLAFAVTLGIHVREQHRKRDARRH
jgi:hypothetical protein